jgi:small multidrug resistance pump
MPHLPYTFLGIAIIAEVIGTSALKASHEFSRLIPSLVVIAGYGTAFYFMSLAMRTIPLGITYAIWSGLGIVLVTIAGMLIYKQVPDIAAIVGMALIICGVAVIHLFSNTAAQLH